MTEQELLVDSLKRLNQSQIPYMLVGSMASNYWGVPRSTHDIDFVIQYESADVDKIVEAFQSDFFIQRASVRSGLKPPYQFNALDNRSALKIDFFRLDDDPYEVERFARRKSISLFEQPAIVATPEDIILHKLRWYLISPSDRQLTDSTGILRVSGDLIDHDYMSYWAKEIGATELLAKLRTG